MSKDGFLVAYASDSDGSLGFWLVTDDKTALESFERAVVDAGPDGLAVLARVMLKEGTGEGLITEHY